MSAHPLVEEVLALPEGPQVAAYFDLDGTIIDGFSISAFYADRLRSGDLGIGEMLDVVRASRETDLDEHRFAELAERAARAWVGKDEDELLDHGRRLLRARIGSSLFSGAWDVVQAHRRRGHTVVVASAASRFQVEPMAEQLGADAVLCTRFEVDDHGLLTGRLDGPPVWGGQKAEAVRVHAEANGLDLALAHGYGNGDEDIAFLATVGNPHAVNPMPGLERHAQEQGWPIVRFEGRGRATPVQALRSAAAISSLLWTGAGGVGLSLLSQDRRAGLDVALGAAGDLSLALAGVDLDVQGREHLWSHRPAVFVFNHQSGVDMPIMMKLVRERFTGVAKAELRDAPGLGALFRWADVAFVDRGDPTQARAAMQPVVDKLREGISIIIAPEGTRSATPRLGPFKKGAFHVAMQAGVPMVPVVIRNAGQIAWRDSLLLRAGTVQVAVLEPVDTSAWSVDTIDEHVADVRRRFVETLAHWPRPA